MSSRRTSVPPTEGAEWIRIVYPRAQVIGESVTLAIAAPAVLIVWWLGVHWLAIAQTLLVASSAIRMMNRKNYGVWVCPGAIDLRGYASRRVIRSSAISRLIVDRASARLEVVAGDAWARAFLGLRGWSSSRQSNVIERLSAWAAEEGLEPPMVYRSGGYASIKDAALGPLRGSVAYRRTPMLPSFVSLMVALVLVLVMVVTGMWLHEAFPRSD